MARARTISAARFRAPSRVLARGPFVTTERVGDLVVRRPRRSCRLLLGPSLARGMSSALRRFRRYLPIPATHVRKGRFGDFVVVQRYVAGAVPLRDVPDAKLHDPAVAAGLRALLEGAERCYAETGWLPDLGGRVYVPGELYDVRRTDNVVLGADGGWWLVDAGATALFHSRRWPTGWMHTQRMLRVIRRLARELGSTSMVDEGEEGADRGPPLVPRTAARPFPGTAGASSGAHASR